MIASQVCRPSKKKIEEVGVINLCRRYFPGHTPAMEALPLIYVLFTYNTDSKHILSLIPPFWFLNSNSPSTHSHVCTASIARHLNTVAQHVLLHVTAREKTHCCN